MPRPARAGSVLCSIDAVAVLVSDFAELICSRVDPAVCVVAVVAGSPPVSILVGEPIEAAVGSRDLISLRAVFVDERPGLLTDYSVEALGDRGPGVDLLFCPAPKDWGDWSVNHEAARLRRVAASGTCELWTHALDHPGLP